ncbi:hypothetical protein [Sorangium sp. So ce542]|uniref:hypothetical protein n=1 Tax=Sorangium sp. So ce542 TaxID=3133316 RepID=UPI003F5E92E2
MSTVCAPPHAPAMHAVIVNPNHDLVLPIAMLFPPPGSAHLDRLYLREPSAGVPPRSRHGLR